MRTIKFLLLLLAATTLRLSAQSTHTVDFEPAGVGNDWEWTKFEFDPTLQVIANPVSGGINTSANVVEMVVKTTDQQWAGAWTTGDGEFTFDATNSTVKIMVYKTVISDVAIKFEGTSAPIEIKVPNTVTGAWEELTFDFSGVQGNTYNKIVVFPDFAARSSDNTIYLDNLQVPDGVVTGPLATPSTAAPTPMHNAANVLSIYSDAYTNVAGTDFNPAWGQSTVITVDHQVDGNNTLLYEGLNYQGFQLAAAQDLSGYDYLHVDFWTPNSSDLGWFLISGVWPNSVEIEHLLSVQTEQWVSVDIPLSNFEPTVNLMDVTQFKVDGNGTVYFDNIYFYKDTSTGLENEAKNKVKVFSANGNISITNAEDYQNATVNVFSLTGQLVRTKLISSNIENIQISKAGIYLVRITDVSGKSITTKLNVR